MHELDDTNCSPTVRVSKLKNAKRRLSTYQTYWNGHWLLIVYLHMLYCYLSIFSAVTLHDFLLLSSKKQVKVTLQSNFYDLAYGTLLHIGMLACVFCQPGGMSSKV